MKKQLRASDSIPSEASTLNLYKIFKRTQREHEILPGIIFLAFIDIQTIFYIVVVNLISLTA